MPTNETAFRLMKIAAELQSVAMELAGLPSSERPLPSKPRGPTEREWTCLRGRKGVVPRFVQELTGLKSKQDVLRMYGHGAVFRADSPPPSKLE